MLFNVIIDKPNMSIKDVMLKIATLNYGISHEIVKCIDDEIGEEYDDEMWFVGINDLDKLLNLASKMKEFDFTVVSRRDDSMDDWGFRLKDEEEEYLYRYPILWLS